MMSWSAKTFWINHSWPSSESIGNRGGIVPTKSGAAKDPAEVKHESTVRLFRGSPLTFTEGNILLISCDPQHWPSPMSWSALTLLEVRCDLLNQSLFDFLQSQSRIGRNQAERTNEIRRFAWQQRVAFSRCLDLPRCQSGLIMLSLALMLSDVWSALTLSEERSASLTSNWFIRTSFLRLLIGLFRQLNMSKKNMFCHNCILFVKCSSDTREDACNYTTDWYNFSIDMGFYSCCQNICHPFRQMIFPFRLWLPSNLVQARTSALFV